jgi:hypothetical protein
MCYNPRIMIPEFKPRLQFKRSENKHSENIELTPVDKDKRKIEEHIKDTELVSARFQAFADFADFKKVELFTGGVKFSRFNILLSLVDETIRQRINGVLVIKKNWISFQSCIKN